MRWLRSTLIEVKAHGITSRNVDDLGDRSPLTMPRRLNAPCTKADILYVSRSAAEAAKPAETASNNQATAADFWPVASAEFPLTLPAS